MKSKQFYILKLVSWSKHVRNAMILAYHWSYMMPKQVIGVHGVTPFIILQDSNRVDLLCESLKPK